jgi:hypothetical protein
MGGVARSTSLVALGIMTLAAFTIYAMGQPLICRCGYMKVWHGGVDDPEVSQHFLDWYTYSHLVHGIVLYAFLGGVVRKPVSLTTTVLAATLLGAIWQIVGNVPVVVKNYAEITMVRDYAGHSIVNSVGDMLATVAGALIAGFLPIWVSVLVALGAFLVPHDHVIVTG